MKIGLASDHRGYQMKDMLARLAQELGHVVTDLGPSGSDSVDYPDFAGAVASGVSSGDLDRGVLVCGTGIGMSIAANKYPQVRAAPCHDTVTAEYSRLHNDLNVLCLSADQLSDQQAEQILRIWLETEFEAGRHARRIEKIREIERHGGESAPCPC